MGPVVLAKNFTIRLDDDTQTFRGDWIPVDAEFQNWLLHTHCQALSPKAPTNGLQVAIETSYDTVEEPQLTGGAQITATGSQNVTIAGGMLGMVRLVIASNEPSTPVTMTVSVWLQPKNL